MKGFLGKGLSLVMGIGVGEWESSTGVRHPQWKHRFSKIEAL
jgi:hypothetical protein